MLHFLKLFKFGALFHFISSDQFEIGNWLQSESLLVYHLYPSLKIVSKDIVTFLE